MYICRFSAPQTKSNSCMKRVEGGKDAFSSCMKNPIEKKKVIVHFIACKIIYWFIEVTVIWNFWLFFLFYFQFSSPSSYSSIFAHKLSWIMKKKCRQEEFQDSRIMFHSVPALWSEFHSFSKQYFRSLILIWN